MKTKNLKQRGISLLEVMLSLAIIAIILVMATRYFGISSRASKLNSTTQQVNEVRAATEQYHQNQGKYPASLGDLASAGFLTTKTANGQTDFANTTISLQAGAPGGTPNVQVSGGWGNADCQNLANRFGSDPNAACSGTTFTIPAVIQQ